MAKVHIAERPAEGNSRKSEYEIRDEKTDGEKSKSKELEDKKIPNNS